MKGLLQFRIKALLVVVGLICAVLAIVVFRSQSLDKIRRLDRELELVLNDLEVKASYESTNPVDFDLIQDEFWVVFPTYGLEGLGDAPAPREYSGRYTIEVGGPSCHLYIEIYRPWRVKLSEPTITIQQPDDQPPYTTLADYVEFALTAHFDLPKPGRVTTAQ